MELKGEANMSKIKIAGLDLKWFLIISAVIIVGCAMGAFPSGMVGAFLFLMVFGELLNLIGNVTPFVKTYLGGGAIVCIFGGAALIKRLGLDIHPYAWMIISVALAKCLNLVPEEYEENAALWYTFVSKNWTAALMLGIGMAYTDMGQIIEAFSPTYVILVLITVFGAIIGSGLVGRLMGFYPIEAAITAGLCMANMGGTGDVAVLMASNRMELMPFAQISSRLGGAVIILLASVLVPLFF